MFFLLEVILLSVFSSTCYSVYGYIPAQPSNDTSQGNNTTDSSKLHLQWYLNGSDWEFVSYQLVGAGSNGTTRGALVHFTESLAGSGSTTTPWIALVSCDYNATDYSEEVDIFTMASDRGAQSALLYSLYSDTCAINPEYANPANFDQVFDIFATQSLSVSRIIEYEFGQIGTTNMSTYGNFDATTLNSSEAIITQSLASGYPVAPGYLIATLQAWNATGTDSTGSGNSSSTGSTGSTSGQGDSGLAMIILYAITGCVSALFCAVIISGAVRAIRHPERYGPRVANGNAPGGRQSRAKGLGRAILDTFPIVRFGTAQGDQEEPARAGHKDVEAPSVDANQFPQQPSETLEMIGTTSGQAAAASTSSGTRPLSEHPDVQVVPRMRPLGQPQASQSSTQDADPLMPEAIGRETCPICIVDFQEGDELRVLPCEGKHRFHQACVDPWLLKLSSSCPLCRQDFHALEAMLSGGTGDHDSLSPPSRRFSQAPSIQQNRFSRYLRFARRRHHELGTNNDDLTDPSINGTVVDINHLL